MKILEQLNINPETEIIKKRTTYSKFFQGRRKGNIHSLISLPKNPLHYKTYNGMEEIDIKFEDYDSNYLSLKNSKTVGFRKDKKLYKMLGIRVDYEHQFEVTPISIKLNDKVYTDLDSFEDIILNENKTTLEHKIDDNLSLWSNIKKIKLRTAIKTNLWLNDFEIKEKIHLKGFKIQNLFEQEGNIKKYVPNKKYEFVFESIDNDKDLLTIPKPKMWNEIGNKSLEINHELIEENGELFYIKYPTEKGKDWLLINKPIFYIDAEVDTIYVDDTDLSLAATSGEHATWEGMVNAEDADAGFLDEDYVLAGATTEYKGVVSVLGRAFLPFLTSGEDELDPRFVCRNCNFNMLGNTEASGLFPEGATDDVICQRAGLDDTVGLYSDIYYLHSGAFFRIDKEDWDEEGLNSRDLSNLGKRYITDVIKRNVEEAEDLNFSVRCTTYDYDYPDYGDPSGSWGVGFDSGENVSGGSYLVLTLGSKRVI